MTQLEALRIELEKEAKTTRKMLAIVPADKFGWKPHPKSMSLKQLATHVAELPTWIGMTLNTDELDFETSPYNPQPISTNQELLAYFEKSIADARNQLAKAKERM